MERIVREIHRPSRINFPRRKVLILGLDETWQSDIADMQEYAAENDGYKFILVVIDTYSKFAWGIPLKSKSGKSTANAFEELLQVGTCRIPQKLQTDHGTEFYNTEFRTVMERYGIHHYSSFTHLKASIAERFIRTMKGRLWPHFSLAGSHRWTGLLHSVMRSYNRTVHRTTGKRPIDVRDNSLMDSVYRRFKLPDPRKPKFTTGDFVRISKHRHQFTKGYLPQWTTEIFQVVDVKHAEPRTYVLKDLNGVEISGRFYTEELQKTENSDVYLIDKVIRRQGNRLLVSWLGFPSSANSWVSKNDLASGIKGRALS